MTTATLRAGIGRSPLGILAGPRAVTPILPGIRRRLGSPVGLSAVGACAFALGLTIAFLFAPAGSEVDRLEMAVYAQAGQLAQLQDQLTISHQESARLGAIQLFSTQHRLPADVAAAIYDAALAEGVQPELAFRLVQIESGFRRTAMSPAGAIGLTQIKPSTAQWVDPTVTHRMLFDTGTNLRIGFRYLSMLLKQYAGNERLALLAYNRGPGRVGELLALGKDPANGYARRVLAP
ncbi:MAG: transglycosylase SLT domain-containing protein [Gemmatimonadetes bacterium]|nr:transglycosylase SLT domain-containing protein [Gemmatimonadota bacterium]